jgi:hypothetical protein
MGNIKNYNFNKLDVKLSNSDYWDFFLANDDSNSTGILSDCLVVKFDFDIPETYLSGLTSTILSSVSWTGATNTGYTFSTIGLTGIDNGLITFKKDPLDTSNLALLSALTGNTLYIPSGDSRLYLNRVTGTTGDITYPLERISDGSGNFVNLCGGFYQGYYKIDGSTYEVLPNRVHKGWVAEFWLNKDDDSCSAYTDTILNDIYPDNKGFFFYMGTRAENKFWNRFEGADTGCTSACTIGDIKKINVNEIDNLLIDTSSALLEGIDTGCTDTLSYWCTVPKETNVYIGSGNNAISLYPSQTTTTEVTNPFLIYGRAHSGSSRCYSCGGHIDGLGSQTICSYDGKPISITKPDTVITNTQNPFLIYGRAHSGSSRCYSCGGEVSGLGNETICSFSGFDKSIQFDNLDYKVDIIDNAIGFRIKDDGSIGYRMLTMTGHCSGTTYISGFTVEEGYSEPGLISDKTWTSVIIRYTMGDYYDDCKLKNGKRRKGKLMFYINGKLKYTVKDFNEFIARRLNDHMEKQVGVPFNMSLGGGSQGLIETQTFDGRDMADLGLPIEKNFAGTFIGGISKFKFNICDLYFTDIQNIYNSEALQYASTYIGYIIQEDYWFILQENNFRIKLE